MALETRNTALFAAGALAAWIALLLLTFQLAYSFDLHWLLARDFEVLFVAMAGLFVTLLFIFGRSTAPRSMKITIALAALLGLFFLANAGGLWVSCANDNCL
jgi:hypothetical protein